MFTSSYARSLDGHWFSFGLWQHLQGILRCSTCRGFLGSRHSAGVVYEIVLPSLYYEIVVALVMYEIVVKE